MNETTTMSRAQFVEAAMHFSLNWRTTISQEVKQSLLENGCKDEALRDVLNAVGPYNEFCPDEVADVLAAVGAELMGVELGRENSPVLYLTIPHWTGQALGSKQFGTGEQLTQGQREKLAGSVLMALMSCKCRPDELSMEADYIGNRVSPERAWVTDTASAARAVVGKRSMTIRAWWD